MKRNLMRYGSMYVLLVLIILSDWGYYHYEKLVAIQEAQAHGEPFVYREFWNRWWSGMFENLQSEWKQLFVQAGLFASPLQYLMWRADQNADKKDVEQLNAKLDRIEAKLDAS